MKIYFEHIYEHIGYLFYAVACEHGMLNAVTYDKLNRIIDLQWKPTDVGQTLDQHLVGCLHSGLLNAFKTSMPAEKAYRRFQEYYNLHYVPFGKPLRSKIISMANTIASEFSGNGKKSALVSALETLLAVNPIPHI
jgi:hypothetical protein